jgi:hypothetical protein
MIKILFALLALGATENLWAQDSKPLVISFFSNLVLKDGQKEIPWAYHYFSLDGYLVHDAIAQMDNGQIIELKATSDDISARKGGIDIYTGFTYRQNAPVSRFCYTNFRVCTTREISSCKAFGENLFFEVDVNTGAAATNIPLAPGVNLPAGSQEFQIQLCSTSNLSS